MTLVDLRVVIYTYVVFSFSCLYVIKIEHLKFWSVTKSKINKRLLILLYSVIFSPNILRAVRGYWIPHT